MKSFDFIAFLIFLIEYSGYQFLYFYLSHGHKHITRESKIQKYRETWLQLVIKERQSILAVQTLRNLTMTVTFLISLTLILVGGIISVFSANLNWLHALDTGNYISFFTEHHAALKLLIACIILLIATFNFIFSLRILNNLNFTIVAAIEQADDISFQLTQLKRQSRYFITGVRAITYFLAPMIWIIDPLAMLIFSTAATLLFFRFDFLSKKDM